MRTQNIKLTAAVAMVGLCLFNLSCATPKLTNSHKGRYKYANKALTDVLDVKVTVIPVPPDVAKPLPAGKTFFDLRDSIPNTFLRIIGEKSTTTKEIIDAIRESLTKTPKSALAPTVPKVKIVDATEFKIRLLFSQTNSFFLNKELLHPNTRMEQLNTTVCLADSSKKYFRFLSIDRIENELESIDMGDLSRTQTIQFNTKLGVDFNRGSNQENSTSVANGTNNSETGKNTTNVFDASGKLIGSADIGSENSSNVQTNSESKDVSSRGLGAKLEFAHSNNEVISEALKLKFKRLKTGFSFDQETILVSQRGIPLTGVVDNTYVTVTVKANLSKTFNVFKFNDLLDQRGVIVPFSNVQIQPIELSFIPCKNYNFDANVSFKGVIRAAENLNRGKNVLEYDDKVKFFPISGNSQTLIKNAGNQFSFCKKVFGINYTSEAGQNYTLVIDNGIPDIFKISEDIHEFKGWLAKALQKTDKDSFIRKDYQLYFQNIKDKSDRVFIVSEDKTVIDLKKINSIKIKSVEL